MTPNQLFNENLKLAYHLASKYHSTHMDRDDLQQIALIGLWRAAVAFDESKGNKFSTLAWRYIKNEFGNAFHHGKLVHNPTQTGRYKDAASNYCDETGVIDSCIGSHEERVCAKVDAERLLKKIPEYEADILMKTEGFELTQTEVAASIGCTKENIRCRVGVAYRNALIVASGEVVDLRSGHDRKKCADYFETARGVRQKNRELKIKAKLAQIAELRANGFEDKEICKVMRLSPYKAKALLAASI